MPDSSSASVETVSTSGPEPRPGPVGPDIDELRASFDDHLSGSAERGTSEAEGSDLTVSDDQVHALDSAHELLARALTSLDTKR